MSESSEASAPDPGVSTHFWRSLGRRLVRFFGWCARPCTRFCSLAWRGAAIGLIVAALFFPAYAGLCMGTGLGAAIDVAGVLLLGIVVLGLATPILLLALALTKRMPLRFKALAVVAIGSLITIAGPFGFSPGFALRLGGWLVVLPMLAGASIGILRHWRARRAGIVSALIALLMLAVAVTGGAVAIHWLTSPGADPYLKEIHAATDKQAPGLDAPDPSQAGPYEVTTLFYGSGTDRRRPEYAQNADLKTEPVDASALLTNLKGFKAWARRKYWMKTALYVHRANHGQFNTVWGRYDAGPPLKHLLARGALLSPEEQRRIAQVYIAAFLEATLRGKSEYVPLFRDHRRAARWLPETVCFNRFADSRLRVVSDFDESIDVTRTTVAGGFQTGANLGLWRHRRLEGRGGWSFQDRAAVLGWNTTGWTNPAPAQAPSYTITLPDDLPARWQLDRQTILSFCLADTCDTCEAQAQQSPAPPSDPNALPAKDPNTPAPGPGKPPIDLTIELVTSDGAVARLPLSHLHPLQPILKVTFTKWPYWERVRFKSATEPVLQTYEIPLSDFVAAHPAFDPGRLKQIRFRFDRTRTAVILLDDVGFIPGPGPIQN